MDERDQYDRICKNEFEAISGKMDQFNGKLDSIHKRMFVDNGTPSIQTRLDRNERMLKVALWIITVVCAASITQVTRNVIMTMQQSRIEK